MEIIAEIFAEIILQVLVWMLEFLGELLVQIVGEAIVELIAHGLKKPFRDSEPLHPVLAALGYAVWGGIAGGVSLWAFPDLFMKKYWLRLANLLLTPLIAGLIMSWVGSWRRRREKEVIRLETFAYGFFFALSMSVVRFVWGH